MALGTYQNLLIASLAACSPPKYYNTTSILSCRVSRIAQKMIRIETTQLLQMGNSLVLEKIKNK